MVERWLANIALFGAMMVALGSLFGFALGGFFGLAFFPALALLLGTLYGLPVALGGLVLVEIVGAFGIPAERMRWIVVAFAVLLVPLFLGSNSGTGMVSSLTVVAYAALMHLPDP